MYNFLTLAIYPSVGMFSMFYKTNFWSIVYRLFFCRYGMERPSSIDDSIINYKKFQFLIDDKRKALEDELSTKRIRRDTPFKVIESADKTLTPKAYTPADKLETPTLHQVKYFAFFQVKT